MEKTDAQSVAVELGENREELSEESKVAARGTVGHVTLLGEIPPQVATWVRGAHLAWKQRSLVTVG